MASALGVASYLIASFAPAILGVAILVTLALLPRTARRGNDDLVSSLLTAAGWSLIAFSLLILSVLAMGVVPGIVALIVAAVVFQRNRRAAQNALLWTLAIAAERGVSLIPAVEAFADDRGGSMGRRAHRLAELLRDGMPLPDALARVPRVDPSDPGKPPCLSAV